MLIEDGKAPDYIIKTHWSVFQEIEHVRVTNHLRVFLPSAIYEDGRTEYSAESVYLQAKVHRDVNPDKWPQLISALQFRQQKFIDKVAGTEGRGFYSCCYDTPKLPSNFKIPRLQ